jgi:hypothetical protein
MKYIFSILLCLALQTGFSQIYKTVGISYTSGTPTYIPAKAGSWLALDTVTWNYYTYNGSTWILDGYRVQSISGCSAPNYTPTKYQSRLVINACTALQGGPELYYYTGSAWLQINEGQTYTAGTGISISGNVISSTVTGGKDSAWQNINLTYQKGIGDTIKRNAPAIAPLWDKGGAVYNVAAYGIYPDGTDQSDRFQALADTIHNRFLSGRGGGHIQFNVGTYRIDKKIKFKTNYNGSNIPQMPDIWISGASGNQSGNAQKPIGGTILDCRYQGDTIGCFQFRGSGQVKITDISFIKGTSGLTNTFIHTTLTTLKISDCSFLGYDISNRCRAIVLGGNTAFLSSPDTSAEMGFQGYGTVIEKNYFNWISTGVMLQTYANAVIIRDNNFWNGCGGFAAIWLACKNDTNTGNVIADNLIEMNHYTWGVYLGVHSVSNSVRGNNFFDGPTGSKNIGSVSSFANTIIEGFNGAGEGYVGSSSINTRIAMDSGDTSFFASNILLRSGNFLGIRGRR